MNKGRSSAYWYMTESVNVLHSCAFMRRRALHAICALSSVDGAPEPSGFMCIRSSKSTVNESSSATDGESTWSSGQQMKMENCYHLLDPFKYM